MPAVGTDAQGRARLELTRDGADVRYDLKVKYIEGVTQAHIHKGLPSENGPVVAFLFGLVDPPTGPVEGRLARGMISQDDLLGPLEGDFDGFVSALRAGELYVNVHTAANPTGEIRGQIGARK